MSDLQVHGVTVAAHDDVQVCLAPAERVRVVAAIKRGLIADLDHVLFGAWSGYFG